MINGIRTNRLLRFGASRPSRLQKERSDAGRKSSENGDCPSMTFKRVGIAVSLFVAATGIATANDLQNADPASCMVNALSGYLSSAPVASELESTDTWVVEDAKSDDEGALQNAVITDEDIASVDPRQELSQFAMQLLDIRYRRGGHAPSTGFDC